MKIFIENEYMQHGWADGSIMIENPRPELCVITCDQEGLVSLAKELLQYAFFSEAGDEFHWLPRSPGYYDGELETGSLELYVYMERNEEHIR
jgi:hypothetical protein